MTDHLHWMNLALSLAEIGKFSASPNPCVGCVIVRDNQLLGQGFHRRAGEPHAEIHALREAGETARGATAYVTLEPCAHYGRTPPCADALIQAGIAEVIIACEDPNPQVAGKGIVRLCEAGILVTTGILEAEAARLNCGFFQRMRTGRPWVTLKLAASMDGKTALANGESQWITGEHAREDGHYQRLLADAVIAGTGSIIQDNARLTARYHTELTANPPLRVIIDSQLKTPANAAIFSESGPILLVTTQAAPIPSPYPAHTEILTLPETVDGKVPLAALLDELGKRQLNRVLVEAGAGLGGAFVSGNLANEILLYQAPTFLGNQARGLLSLPLLSALSDRIRYSIDDSRPLGQDWRFTLIQTTDRMN